MSTPAAPKPAVLPVKTGRFNPKIGDSLTVTFAGETMRCRCVEIVDTDRVIVEVSSEPMSRRHQYRKGDKIGVRRRIDPITHQALFEALDDRDFIRDRSPFEMKPGLSDPGPEPKRAAPKRKRRA